MKSRLVASAALSALVLLGATGCTFITPQSTKTEYAASDGVTSPTPTARSMCATPLVIATDDGSVGNFIARHRQPDR